MLHFVLHYPKFVLSDNGFSSFSEDTSFREFLFKARHYGSIVTGFREATFLRGYEKNDNYVPNEMYRQSNAVFDVNFVAHCSATYLTTSEQHLFKNVYHIRYYELFTTLLYGLHSTTLEYF